MMKSINRTMKVIIGLLILAAIAGVFIYRFATREGEAAPPSIDQLHQQNGVPVDVATVELRDLSSTVQATGVLEGVGEVSINTTVPMRINAIHVSQGSRVQKNQKLVSLDPLTSASFYSSYEAARIQLEDAQRNLRRMKPLFEAGAISEADWDAVQSAVRIAQAGVTNLEHSATLHSPISGTVTSVIMKRGDMANPGDAIMTVATTDKLKMVATVGQRSVGLLAVGNSAVVLVPTAEGKTHDMYGRITEIGLSADPDTRLFRVEIVFDNKEGLLHSGTLHQVEIITHTIEQAMGVPVRALVEANGQSHLFLVADGESSFIPVEIGLRTTDWVQITGGVSPGDQVVVNGQNLLNRGEAMKVQIHRPADQN